MRTIRLLIGFIGTRYEGWQSQKKGPSTDSGLPNTVQEIFEKYLKKILKEDTGLISSSRTDSGVHALGLVAHFKTNSNLPDFKIKEALNFYLPRDIVVQTAKTMPRIFHARYDAKSKLYCYKIWNQPTRPLFEDPFVLWQSQALDLKAMRKAALFLKGKHDFASFQGAGGDEPKTTIRTIKKINLTKKTGLIRIEIEGDGFLRHMVRVIVGTLIEIGRKKIKPGAMKNILAAKDRKQAGPTAKARGLTLVKVKY
ncbi:MAG: tRNA pseudouridine(38-40) synthase TruA [Candidatus Omnitrophica bacterium CG1_02_46_14]|nr:MAG: tRNA pseudouridine(38-40) synthase TruA [Candidatus Omnitrophica bacterium CG1_02_46_14]